MEYLKFKSMYFEVTHFCNQFCQHCFLDSSNKHKLKELDTVSIKKILDNFKEQGGESVFLTGGEPFARDDIFEIFDHCEGQKISFMTSSNGILLNEEKIRKLSKYNFSNGILTSLLGSTKEEHDEMANKNGFDKVLNNLELFDKYDIRTELQVTLRKGLIEKIPIIAKMLEPYKCNIKFTPVTALGVKDVNNDNKNIIVPKEEYPTFLKCFDDAKGKYGDKISSHNLLTGRQLTEYIKYFDDKPLYSLGEYSLIIRPNGSINFSYSISKKWRFGNATQDIRVPVDDKLKDYIEKLKIVDREILEIANLDGAVDFEFIQTELMNQ